MPVIIHHEIDKLVLVHSSPTPDLFKRWDAIQGLIHHMAALGLHVPQGAATRKHIHFENADCTLGVSNQWGRVHVTARIRTQALHSRFARAYRSAWNAIHALPWVHGGVYLGDIHLCADVVDLLIEDEQVALFDDQTPYAMETERTVKTVRGKKAVGGATYRWKRDGRVYIIVYHKPAELRRHRKKADFMKPLYRKKGWDGVQPITRVEVRPSRDQILAHYDQAGRLDLTALWRTCLQDLRYTTGETSAAPSTSPTAGWWNDILGLQFSLRTLNPPLPPEIRRHSHERALAQADGIAAGGLAKKIALHLLGEDLLPPLPAPEAETYIETALLLQPAFAEKVALKAEGLGLNRASLQAAPWPTFFIEQVLAAWDARQRRCA